MSKIDYWAEEWITIKNYFYKLTPQYFRKPILIIVVILSLLIAFFNREAIFYFFKPKFAVKFRVVEFAPTFLVKDINGNLINEYGSIFLELFNKSNDNQRIESYQIEGKINKRWIDLRIINFNFGDKVYHCSTSLEKCYLVSFEDGIFDLNLRNKDLKLNESVKGWLFLQDPPILHAQSNIIYNFEDLKISFIDLEGKKSSFFLNKLKNKTKTNHPLSSTQFSFSKETEDLSRNRFLN
jgi:hypothetical protein